MLKKINKFFRDRRKRKELEVWEMSLDIKSALIKFIIDYQACNYIIDTPQNIVKTALGLYEKHIKTSKDVRKYHKMLVNFKKGA